MKENLIKKIKEKMVAGAHSSAEKIEEAARTGKLHIRIIAERRKLFRTQAELGKAAFLALEDNTLESLKENPETAQLINDIKFISKKIIDLEETLKEDDQEREK